MEWSEAGAYNQTREHETSTSQVGGGVGYSATNAEEKYELRCTGPLMLRTFGQSQLM